MKLLVQTYQKQLKTQFNQQIQANQTSSNARLEALANLKTLVNFNPRREMRKAARIIYREGLNDDTILKITSASMGIGGNQFKGEMGEKMLTYFLQKLDDTWIAYKNVYLPNYNQLTEIDLILIGIRGIFLIEIKNWRGSFSAYKDYWKKRQGNAWIKLDNSPTKQSKQHLISFLHWLSNKDLQLPSFYTYAPVFFTCADWVGVRECSVPVYSRLSELITYIDSTKTSLSSNQIVQISQLIQNYHT